MSPHVLITENTTYCTDIEGVEVAASAMPHLERWMREHGHVRRGEHLRDQLAHTTAPVVVDAGDE